MFGLVPASSEYVSVNSLVEWKWADLSSELSILVDDRRSGRLMGSDSSLEGEEMRRRPSSRVTDSEIFNKR